MTKMVRARIPLDIQEAQTFDRFRDMAEPVCPGRDVGWVGGGVGGRERGGLSLEPPQNGPYAGQIRLGP